MNIVFIVNGFPLAGKDTFINHFFYLHRNSNIDSYARSSIDKVKEIAEICGWNGTKSEKDRNFLSALKDILTNYNDLPYNDITRFITNSIKTNKKTKQTLNIDKHLALFTCIREPSEIQKLILWCITQEDIDHCFTIFIRGKNEIKTLSNTGDSGVEDFVYDYYFSNNGTIEDFHKKIEDFSSSLIDSFFKRDKI